MSTEQANIHEQVQQLFREFGRASCNMIARAIVREGSLANVINNMGLPDPGYNDDRLAMILNYVRRQGVGEFLSKLNPISDASDCGRLQPVVPSNHSRHRKQPLYASPEARALQARLQERKQARKNKDQDTWDGEERRSGSDRRQSDDRRQRVELIFHNSRLNEERRGAVDRRRKEH